ncbi:restriction endonuclease subunit S [Acinetobacter tandoii]
MSNNVEFKPTEIGSIPNDWHTTELKDVLTIGHGKPQFSIEDENGKYPILATGGILGYTNHYLYNKPSVLIGRKGTIDKPQYMDTPFWTVDTLFYTNINEKFSPKFIYYKFYLIDWKRRSEASGVPSLSSSIINEQIISYPQLAEQQKIAQALTDADNYISALEKLIEKKKMIKEGLMANLLTGKQRLKEFAFNEDGTAKGYKDSELGKIPEDWDLYNLDEIADVIDPHPSHRAPPIDRDGIPFLGIGDFSTDGKIINNNPRLVNISVFKEHRERYQLEDNLIGLGRVASIGKVIRLNANEKYSISPTLGIIRGTSVSNDLIFYLLSSRFVSLQFNRILSGSTRSSVGMNVLREVKIALPQSPKEQLSLGKLLIDIDQDIQKLESKYQKSHDLKQGMMQKLLTGEIRLV